MLPSAGLFTQRTRSVTICDKQLLSIYMTFCRRYTVRAPLHVLWAMVLRALPRCRMQDGNGQLWTA